MEQPDALSLLPIFATLLVALSSRNVLAGLAVGLFVGVLMLSDGGLLDTAGLLVTDHLVPQLMDSYNAAVLVLLVFIGGFVALMEQSGGGAAFARDVTRWLTSRLRLQLAAWAGGILIFFSDLGTPLIVGPVFRSLADRLGLSRQKLAFIVDSTASPVAILIPFIGWGVYIMSLLNQQFDLLGITWSDYDAFVAAIPFQFYAWLAVLLAPLLAMLKLDYGAMSEAETQAETEAETEAETVAMGNREDSAAQIGGGDDIAGHAYFIWLPLLVLGAVLCWILIPLGFPFGRVSGGDFRAALSVAYLCAALTLLIVMTLAGTRRLLVSIGIYFEGMSRMMQVAVMLVLAWALSDVGAALGTADYVAGVAATSVPGWLVPVLTFLLSAVISFATGSSWGTFAIMFPLAIPAAEATGAPLAVVIGAVLSGGLFGDHSSPISETTILSATGAGCDQFAHFRTQVPYALTNGAIAVSGFLLAGITGAWWTLPLVLVAQVIVLLTVRLASRRLLVGSPG